MESLIAMLVLALGVGALAWTQARQLADGRDTAARSMAVLLTEDLANRIQFNRDAAANGGYTLDWSERPEPVDCRNISCSGAMLARADLSSWRDALAQALPGSNARVFDTGNAGRPIGIAISWHSPVMTVPAWQRSPSTAALPQGLDCEAHSSCHVTYIPI